jgi:methionyl-tRNA synthetase
VETFYATTPIYYVNGPPHPGHSYTTIVVDSYTRFARLEGKEAFSLTGTDEHGDKIVRAAVAEGIEPQQYVDRISGMFRDLWPTLHVEHDDFIRTTQERHKKVVVDILQKVYDAGEIYFGEHSGLYCFGCERFMEEEELVEGKCTDHGVEPTFIKEKNYFFRMSAYQEWLIDYLKTHPNCIRPQRYMNEVLSFLEKPLRDLSISRPKTRLEWGITLPFDDEHVTYVWFDALINYVSAMGWPDGERFEKFWPAEHFLAKDIVKTHGIYWPCMLKAAGIPMFKHLNVHGYWNAADGRKMSKTLGNQIDTDEIRDRYGADVYRYALMREMVFGQDANISEGIIARRMNTDLSNDFGNLISRTVKLVSKNFDGTVPEVGALQPEDEALRDEWLSALQSVRDLWNDLKPSQALERVMECVRATNRYFDAMKPWELARDGVHERLATVLYTALEGLRIASCLLHHVMPEKTVELRTALGLESAPSLEEAAQWNVLKPGEKLGTVGTLFPRADLEEVEKREQTLVAQAQEQATKPETLEEPDESALISIDDVRKVDLRVGTILTAEPVKKAKKLIKLTVDIGEETPRQLVGGLAEHYTPEELPGKRVIVVANLQPATIRGVESQGMLLAADDGKTLAILEPDKDVPNGAGVR